MKNTILSRLIFFAVIPFLIIFFVSSAFVIRAIFNDKMIQVKLELENLVQFNTVNFQGHIENTRLSVMIAVTELKNIDPARPDARIQGENVILASFENDAIINSWFIFEPDAFDGRDKDHRGEYPGETSGRFMRSYNRSNSGYIVAPDMDETLLDDIDISYWYIVPKMTGKPFIDISSEFDVIWDYGLGEGSVNSISIAAPIFRENKFIGCVGQDILLEDVLLGPEIISGAVSALFSPGGTLMYYKNLDDLGISLEGLGFANSDTILEAFARKEKSCLFGDYSPLLGAEAFACFVPVTLKDFEDSLYLYAAIPENMLHDAVFPVLKPLVAAFIIDLALFILLLLYFTRSVLKPVRSLTTACEAIAGGNFDWKLYPSRAGDEIGIMARSLRRMVEQFRAYITLQERSKNQLEIYTRLYRALYRYNRIEDVFAETIPLMIEHFGIYRASLVLTGGGPRSEAPIPATFHHATDSGESARFAALYERDGGLRKGENRVFMYHEQVKALLAGKKYISLNANIIKKQKIGFAGENTISLCLLPFLAGEKLRAYIIMEGDSESGPLVHSDADLLFLSETISYILTQREAGEAQDSPPPASPEAAPLQDGPEGAEEELPVLKTVRAIEGLDVDKGLFLSGGVEEQYVDLLRISVKVFDERIKKMRSLLRDKRLSDFAIEIHGIKGALYAIGADSLGNKAKELEFAAKEGNAAFCADTYPVFEEKLTAFNRLLAAIIKSREIPSLGPGSMPQLIASLGEALEAVRQYNLDLAGKIIASLRSYSWEAGSGEPGEKPVAESLEQIADSLEYMEYDEAESLISLLLKNLGVAEAGT
ncbi:MAG: HAMP domain-containing protein [Spirochaetaceae bacterium]|jgi:HPt (histidine-containing phosphotransfer) domain-containing protein/HAMP domain-containing protein|nr:HAMP domain-containing protein [Spirochaetaceae bacterium]